MGNYVCRTNRADTVDSIEPLANNPALVSTTRQSQDVSKKLNEWVVIIFVKILFFYKGWQNAGVQNVVPLSERRTALSI